MLVQSTIQHIEKGAQTLQQKYIYPLNSAHNHHLDANDQKFNIKDGDKENQLIKAIAVAVSNLVQWFKAHLLRSLSIRTVIPADAQAAANVRVEVICTKTSPFLFKSITNLKQWPEIPPPAHKTTPQRLSDGILARPLRKIKDKQCKIIHFHIFFGQNSFPYTLRCKSREENLFEISWDFICRPE